MPDVIEVLKDAHRKATPLTPFDLDDSIRRGRRRRRRQRIANAGAGVGVAAGVTAAAILLPGGSPELPDPAEEATFAILDEPQQAVDRLPPTVRPLPSRIDLSSTRLIGKDDGLSYWLAMDEEDDICVVVAERGTWISTGCGGSGWLQLTHRPSRDGITSAFLIPDGMELEIAQHAGFTVLSENLAVSTMTEGEREELAEVLEHASEYFSVFMEPQRRSDRLPDAQNRSDRPFTAAASRFVGEHRDVRYWIGALETGTSDDYRQICLIGITGGGEWRGTSCSHPLNASEVEPHWPLERTDPEDSTRLALVPDDYELTDEQVGTWERVAPNLYHDTESE